MSVNGVTGSSYTTDAYKTYASSKNQKASEASDSTASKEESGAVYEPSKDKVTYKPNTKLIAQMKADADARTEQMRSLVEKLMAKQGTAYNNANDIWSFLREGNFTVDAATKAQAQKDISEDGYWGVKQTSDRIISFATALTGGDPSKIEKMRSAFLKGYKQAEKTWGGKLPSICKDTYDAVLQKFDDMASKANEAESTTTN